MKMKLSISCKEANHVCDKTQYKEANLYEKIILNIHLIYCKACRNYSKKNTKLTKLINKKPVSLDAESKESLKAAFEKELANKQ